MNTSKLKTEGYVLCMKIVGCLLLGLFIQNSGFSASKEQSKTVVLIHADPLHMMTQTIQRAIDSCSNIGGGTVIFASGTYLCGGIEMKSKVGLHKLIPYVLFIICN